MESKFSIQNLKPLQVKYESRNASEASVLTIVNTNKHGKRVVLAQELIEKIGSPDKIQIAPFDEGIALSSCFSTEGTYFQLRQAGKIGVFDFKWRKLFTIGKH